MSDHRWQSFTDTCTRCGYNMYDPKCPDRCGDGPKPPPPPEPERNPLDDL